MKEIEVTINDKTPPAPTKLSAAIQLALEDLEVIEQSDDYKVDMREWHHPNGDELDPYSKCCVCFAGSVMAVTHQMPWGKNICFVGAERDWDKVFRALDAIRQGRLRLVLKCLGLRFPLEWVEDFAARHGMVALGFSDINVVTYWENRRSFKRDMREIAKALEIEGL